MSQAETLLNTLSNETIIAENHIVVNDNRTITVPSELKRIAVQYDHNMETVTFDCPRYWDNYDLSSMAIYINYKLPNGDAGAYAAENITIDETDDTIMHFEWTITRNVTAYKGRLTFLVCVKTTDDDGNESIHWNSELNHEMYISEGLECFPEVVEPYPDVLTQLVEKVNLIGRNFTGKLGKDKWTVTDDRFTQRVTITGLTREMTPIFDMVVSTDKATAKAEKTSWGYITRAYVTTNTLIVECDDYQPAVDINFMLKVV